MSYFWENEYAEGEKKQEFTRTMRIFVQTKPRLSLQKIMEIIGVRGLTEWILDKDSVDRAINAIERNFATTGNCQKHHRARVLPLKVSLYSCFMIYFLKFLANLYFFFVGCKRICKKRRLGIRKPSWRREGKRFVIRH